MSVLLVEDDASIALVITAALEAEGFAVTCCDSIAERDRLLARQSFDALVTDVMLTDGDGIETIGAVRAAAPQMPIIRRSAPATPGPSNISPSRSTSTNWRAPSARLSAMPKPRAGVKKKYRSRACRWSAARRRCRRFTG
jgi:CheY-like chemotaxis protein